jgi:hypothetical protein
MTCREVPGLCVLPVLPNLPAWADNESRHPTGGLETLEASQSGTGAPQRGGGGASSAKKGVPGESPADGDPAVGLGQG